MISPRILNRKIRLFADDCVCYREIKNVEDTASETSEGYWAQKLGMRFQLVKCNMMQLTNKRTSKIQAFRYTCYTLVTIFYISFNMISLLLVYMCVYQSHCGR